MDTSGSSTFHGQAGAHAGAAAGYSPDPNAQDDYAHGAAAIDSTYDSSHQNLSQMNAGCSGILSGLAVLNDPNATLGDKVKAIATIDAGIAGTLIVGTTAAAELGLISAAAATVTIPVIGVILVAVVALVGLVLAAFDVTIPGPAEGNPVTWSSADLAYETIAEVWSKIPLLAPKGVAFTDDSRRLASLLASFVQAQRAAAGLSTLALDHTPTHGEFGYQTSTPAAIHLQITAMLGSDGEKAAQVESIVAVLYDGRWPGIESSDSYAHPELTYGAYAVLGTGDEIDPNNPQGIPVISSDPYTHKVLDTVTDRAGLSAASRLIELAAALYLGNVPNAAGTSYAMVYLHLCQISWIYKTAGMPVPPQIYAATGFLLAAAVDNSTPLIAQLELGAAQTAVRPVAGSSLAGAVNAIGKESPLDIWVSYYLARASQAPGV